VALTSRNNCAGISSAVAIIATAFGVLGSLRGMKRRSSPAVNADRIWIASRRLSSGARSRDPLARNDGQISSPHIRGILCWRCRAHLSRHDGCGDQPIHRKAAKHFKQESTMSKSRFLGAAIASAILSTAALASAPANAAVVYCKTAGVPQGCVMRTQPVVVAPVVRPVAPIYRAAVVAPPATIRHVGYTRVTPYGVRHVGYTRVRR
jgi:hypothetical protein